MTSPISLRTFLLHARSHLEASLRQKQPLHFIIGNESADLDSITSTLLYAYFRSFSYNNSSRRPTVPSPTTSHSTAAFSRYYIPLLNIPSADISIRPELLTLLRHVDLEQSQLFTLSDLPSAPYTDVLPAENTSWTLVDHNALQGTLGTAYSSRVIGCIDHHDDEGKVPLSEEQRDGEPRVIEVAGSCTSLVIEHFQSVWDNMLESAKPTIPPSSDNAAQGQGTETLPSQPEIATQPAKLALASILIDTSNLQNEDKTTSHDQRAVAFLSTKIPDERFDGQAYFRTLQAAKKDLDGLSVNDVLRKDYKEWKEGGRTLGISSVVKPLAWLSEKARTESTAIGSGDGRQQAFKSAIQAFAKARELAVYSIMTTSTSAKTGEFTRELMLYVREPAATGMVQIFEETAGERLGLEQLQQEGEGEILRLSEAKESGFQVWQQRKVENSRKQVAPLLREAMASL